MQPMPSAMGRPSCLARARALAIRTRDRACRVSPSRRVNKLNTHLETEGGFSSKTAMAVTSVLDDLVEHSVSKLEAKLDSNAKEVKEKLEKLDSNAKEVMEKLDAIAKETAEAKQQVIIGLGILGAVLFLKPQSLDLVALLGTLAGLFK